MSFTTSIVTSKRICRIVNELLSYNWIDYGVGNLISAIQADTSYGGYTVQTMGAMTGQYIMSTGCQLAIVLVLVALPASVEAISFLGLTWGGLAALGANGVGVAYGCGAI